MKEVVYCKDCFKYGSVPPGEPAICGNCGSCDTEVYWEKLQTAGCPTCGAKLVTIRGRHPHDDRRKVCPTCLQERMDYIRDLLDPNYGIPATDKEPS